MKPINLTISAFGPYKDKVNIDFNVFFYKLTSILLLKIASTYILPVFKVSSATN